MVGFIIGAAIGSVILVIFGGLLLGLAIFIWDNIRKAKARKRVK